MSIQQPATEAVKRALTLHFRFLLCLLMVVAAQSTAEEVPEGAIPAAEFEAANKVVPVPKDFQPYLKRFLKEASSRHFTVDRNKALMISIHFGFNLDDYGALAYCDLATHEIRISESYWHTATDLQREALLFHELGHCLLGRSHENGLMSLANGPRIYRSIMNSTGDKLMYRTCDDRIPAAHLSANKLNSLDWDPSLFQSDCDRHHSVIIFPDPTQRGYPVVFDPKSQNSFYRKFHQIYLDELFGSAMSQ